MTYMTGIALTPFSKRSTEITGRSVFEEKNMIDRSEAGY